MLVKGALGGFCIIEYPTEIYIKLCSYRSRKIPSAYNLRLNCQTILNFYADHDCITAVLCAIFQNEFTNEADVTDERVFARYKFKMGIGRISYIATGGSVFYINIFEFVTCRTRPDNGENTTTVNTEHNTLDVFCTGCISVLLVTILYTMFVVVVF